MRKILLFCVSALVLLAASLHPVQQATIKAAVLDMVISQDKIFIATDASKVVVLDRDFHPIREVKVRKIKDFMGTLNDADIYSVDVMDGKVLFLAQAEEGYSELFLNDGNKTMKVLDRSKMLYAKAAKFVDSDHAVLALMSDEAVLYDIAHQKILKRAKLGEYFYSTMAMDKDHRYFAVGDEGGEVIVVEARSLKRVKLFKDINKDKILSIDINKNMVAAGSRADKTLAIYDWKAGWHKVVKNPDFFIYVVGLSPDNRYVVYGDNDKYVLKVLDVESMEPKYELIGHKNIVNVVRFIDSDTIITGSETGEIMKWRLK